MADFKLSELTAVQHAFDAENFSGTDTPEGKRRHVMLHLGILMGKISRVEEQVDHGITDTTAVRDEVIPDLLVSAAQLADLEGIDLADAYEKLLGTVALRNGTGQESVTRAFDSLDK